MTLAQQDIDVLLKLCKKGNQLAQLEVYNRYQNAMYNVALRIVKDSAEAEDIMQESFLTAFNKLHDFKGDAAFGAWLKRIVVNNSIAQYRKSKRFVDVPDNVLQTAHENSASDTSFDEDYSHVQSRELMQCMSTLNGNYRNILTLFFIEGYDYEEICEILQISYANCRTLISRAKESLRQKLAHAS